MAVALLTQSKAHTRSPTAAWIFTRHRWSPSRRGCDRTPPGDTADDNHLRR
jgi:hypothetical protein